MKHTLLTLLLSSSIGISMAQQSYTLNGTINGKNANGQTVKLLADNEQTTLATTIIKNNKFQIKGNINDAQLIKLVFAPNAQAKQDTWRASSFYLDRGNISFTGHIDSLPSYYYRPNLASAKPTIEGSMTQSLADQLYKSTKEEVNELSRLNETYLIEYHRPAIEDKFNTERGIAILEEMAPYRESIFQKKWAFIKKNPSARVSLDEAMYTLAGYGDKDLSQHEMDELLTIFEKDWKGTKPYSELQEAVTKAKATAIGSKILDGPILDTAGNKVQLSSVFPKDKKYILLEFWASWCGPCRGEIPHLRHTMANWKDKGFDIVSISLDEKDSDWRKAMTEENMDWHQYNAPEGFKSQIAKSYDIQGIPYALLIDSEGRIVRHGMRGASLDRALEELIK